MDLLPHLILPAFFLVSLVHGHLSGLPRDVAGSLSCLVSIPLYYVLERKLVKG